MGLPRRRATSGVNQKIFENLQRPRRLRGFPTHSVGPTLIRFSIFSESGQKHCLGCLFLWFISFGQAKEMNTQIKTQSF